MRVAQRRSGLARLAPAAAMILVAGCDALPTRDPPTRIQISCSPSTSPAAATLVFVLDTGLHEVVWANGPDTPEGRLEVSDYLYRFDFPQTARAHASRAVINRFDGAMDREFGTSPLLKTDGTVGKGNVRQTWTCATRSAGPKF
jgi:hypothetical protein